MDIVQKRDRFYRGSFLTVILFALAAGGLMIGFKRYEGYFDSHGRMPAAAQADLTGQGNTSAGTFSKRNFQVTVLDEPGARLVIPFSASVQKDNITIGEEFVQDKLVITLKDGISYMEEGAVLTSDAAWTEAVGVYKKDRDIVIEVYCKETCGYQTAYENGALTLSFEPLREQQERVLVVYMPWENRSSLLINEWNQSIQKLQEDYHVKIFSASMLQEKYQAGDVISFANRVHADMVIGMELVDTDVSQIVTVCNPDYFIPGFGNVELAALQEQEYAQKTGMAAHSVKGCEEKQGWLKKSKVPAALTQIPVSAQQKNAEHTYTLNQKIMEALESIIKQLAETYWMTEEGAT